MSITPTFRIEYVSIRLSDGMRFNQQQAWPTKYAGRPSDENLAKFVKVHEDSTAPGGINAHLGQEQIRSAKVIRQSNDVVVAEFDRPAFVAV